MKNFIYIIITSSLLSCSSLNNKETTSNININKNEFTEFYKVLIIPIIKKEKFTIKENKTFDIKIINNGTKDLYVPKWLNFSSGKFSELYIELYKKNGEDYELYKQVSKLVTTNNQSSTYKREILSSKNGNPICLNDIELDSFLKIVDSGDFLAKIFIDLSDFGYFKILETEISFEVKN